MKSEFLSLEKSDLVKGCIMAVLTFVFGGLKVFIEGMIATPSVYPTWAQIEHLGLTGLSIGALYLLKNFMTNSKDQLLKSEPTDIIP